MGQVTPKLRRAKDAYVHWCPGCEEPHRLPDSWQFNGNLDQPTFTPSFKHSGVKRIMVNGEWAGEWVRDAQGKPVPFTCHYILTNGILNYCGDCTHSLVGKSIPLPDLPTYLTDES
jgi:hypothetical protein